MNCKGRFVASLMEEGEREVMSSKVSPLFIRRTKSIVMSLQTIKEGQLFKRGKINTEWRQRLFILNGKQLAYFKGGVSVIVEGGGGRGGVSR